MTSREEYRKMNGQNQKKPQVKGTPVLGVFDEDKKPEETPAPKKESPKGQ